MKKIFVLIAFVATVIPTVFVIQEVGGWQNWHGVLPRGTTDSLYYYARMHEVVDGHPLIGNPYAYEHRDALSPAFFLPDVISALPALVGVSFTGTVLLNAVMWSFFFLVLSFSLLRLLGMPKGWAVLWSVLAYVCSYSFMLRPTVMQIVYPVFLLFLLALLQFLYEPLMRRRAVWLSLAAAATFYTYSYLSYIVFITFTFLFCWFLFTRRTGELRALIMAGIGTAILLIPFGIYTLLQMQGPHYFEMFSRIGLVATHIPSVEAFYYGRWVVIGLAVLGILSFFLTKSRERISERTVFWMASGAGLLGGLFLNVITGVELTLGVHIGRFLFPWLAMILGVALYEWWAARSLQEYKRIPYLAAGLLLLVLAVGVVRSADRGLDVFGFNNRGDKIADVQAYAAPLAWLETQVPEQSVVWANDSLAQYIPVMTKHYVLFQLGVGLHAVSDDELVNRYLLSRSRNVLTGEDLKRDFGLYAGAGAGELQPLAQNQRAWFCGIMTHFFSAGKCPPATDAISLRGEEYFNRLEQRFLAVKKNRAALLRHFHVKYLIIDRAVDGAEDLSLSKAVYDDGRFAILSLPL